MLTQMFSFMSNCYLLGPRGSHCGLRLSTRGPSPRPGRGRHNPEGPAGNEALSVGPEVEGVGGGRCVPLLSLFP